MAHNGNSHSEPQVPAEMLERHRAGWHAFTRLTLWHCIGLAVFLLLMLLFFKIL